MIQYECGNAIKLAKKLYKLTIGDNVTENQGTQEIRDMERMIEIISVFEMPTREQNLKHASPYKQRNIVGSRPFQVKVSASF